MWKFITGRYYLFDINEKKVIMDGNLFSILPFKGKRTLFDSEIKDLYLSLAETGMNPSEKKKYSKLILESKLDENGKKKLLQELDEDYSSLDEFDEIMQDVNSRINPLHPDPSTFSSLLKEDVDNLDKSMNDVQKMFSRHIVEKIIISEP